jgi:CheY-like chemotaxis protein
MSNRTVLVIEDDKDLSNIYTLILERAGYQVRQSFNGEEALKEIAASKPRLILLDIFMPVMDGKTFLQTLNLADYPKTRIVVCSNTADPELVEEMLSLGADKFVTKATLEPNDIESLAAEYFTTEQ